MSPTSKVVSFNSPTTSPSTPGSITSFPRRLSSIFPAYIRRKSNRKDSIFTSESTTTLYPFFNDKLPTLCEYTDPNIKNDESSSTFKFGWINGVYVRTVLNIWGVMLFLRMGWMTGHAGIALSIVIVLVSTLVTLGTAISMSAICTNGEVGTGGIYYMISRSLGAEAGSMIGIIFSFANAVLVSANLVGAAETAVEILGASDILITNNAINDTRLIGALLLVLIAIIPLIGMSWEARAMLLLMVLLIVSLINYFVGTFLMTDDKYKQGFVGWDLKVATENLKPKWDGVGFFEVFGVFFPSVIGIFAGASMSGDLKNANDAIPKGTFLAIATTSSVYILLILCLGFTVYPYASNSLSDVDYSQLKCLIDKTCTKGLINDYQTMTMSSGYGPLIWVGIFAATLSSALGSYVCAPRIFQALCEDNLFPYIKYFAKGYGEINDPRRGYVLTFIISLAFICIGDLNAIAPIISNFFMASFSLVNMACFHSSFVDYISAIVTVVIMGVIYLYMAKKGPDVSWGSSKKTHMFNSVLTSAIKLNQTEDSIKDFKPSILLLTGNPSARIPLLEFANNITKNRSLLFIAHIINTSISLQMREQVINKQYEWMSKRRIKGFYLLMESNSLKDGSKNIIQASGLGRKLRPNILMLGYKSSWKDCLPSDLNDYYNVLLIAIEMELSLMILRIQEGLDFADFFESSSNLNTGFTNALSTIAEPNENGEDIGGTQENGNKKVDNTIVNIDNIDKSKKMATLKCLIPNDAVEAMNQFNKKQEKGTIDIWLLADDGGLTILIPYILSLNDIWRDCRLRFLTMAANNESITETKDNLLQLMSKLRIPCTDVLVFAESDLEITEKSELKFNEIITKFIVKNDLKAPNDITVTNEEVERYKDRTNKYLKLRQLLIENSSNTILTVMTLPMANKQISVSLYMSWLEVLTNLTDSETDCFYRMPPFLLIRGIGQRVISV
ncbi:solute carrier family 12 member 1-like [Oppia nitens]|uniref:solute carrier family 12 member 1-like n=1 Tax=Oppia nitens TaxID=1686743 RepID=UPI0023DC9220|nr:solute carrier family 12 member 1-like [Oppia nitens]